jgi:hypothetical protein
LELAHGNDELFVSSRLTGRLGYEIGAEIGQELGRTLVKQNSEKGVEGVQRSLDNFLKPANVTGSAGLFFSSTAGNAGGGIDTFLKDEKKGMRSEELLLLTSASAVGHFALRQWRVLLKSARKAIEPKPLGWVFIEGKRNFWAKTLGHLLLLLKGGDSSSFFFGRKGMCHFRPNSAEIRRLLFGL